MEVENKEHLVTIFVGGQKESYHLLKDIQNKCDSFIKDLCENKPKTIEEFKEIIYNIETSSEFNYYFLKFLKDNGITYEEDDEEWNYDSNLKMLKETLTDTHYKSLEKNGKRSNPLEEIKNILNYYVQIYKEKLKENRKKKLKKIKKRNRNNKGKNKINKKDKRNNKERNIESKKRNNKEGNNESKKRNNKERNIESKKRNNNKDKKGKINVNKERRRRNKKKEIIVTNLNEKKEENKYNYTKLIHKNKLKFQKLNFPLITGIERLRVNYYRDLILEKDITDNCGLMEKYIKNMEKDEDIFNDSLNSIKFNSKTFLLILMLTTIFESANDEHICNYFSKKFLDDDDNGNYTHIKAIQNGEYEVTTIYETKTIDGKNYILSGLNDDIKDNKFIPLDFLLLRNESYEKFKNESEKGFIGQLGLYESFINYIKFFINSNVIRQIFDNKDYYKNIRVLLFDDNYIKEMLDDTHFRFLPFYGTKNCFGYTNKDLMMCFINSVPEVPNKIKMRKKEEVKNCYHICLLFSIGVKFVTSLHEFIIHLTHSYLHYFSNKKLDSISFKEEIDQNDGGFHFERLLKGTSRFAFLNINSIITLLDGVSCTKDLSEFQKDLNAEIDIDTIIEKNNKKQFKGFLGEFLKKYPIDFNYFKEVKNITVSCRGFSDIGINFMRNECDSYGGGKAIN